MSYIIYWPADFQWKPFWVTAAHERSYNNAAHAHWFQQWTQALAFFYDSHIRSVYCPLLGYRLVNYAIENSGMSFSYYLIDTNRIHMNGLSDDGVFLHTPIKT